jgi:DNA-binding transcriptional LysR family regulator
MHVRSLKVFCDVVNCRSFSAGASENGMSQSGASQIVHQIESSLGVQLIDRSKRPIALTPEGEVYYDGCRKLVQRYLALQDEVRSLHQDVAGRVHVASIYSVGLSYARELTEGFRERFPNARVHIEYDHPDRVYELVAEERVDLGLVSYARATHAIKVIEWREEPMWLVCAAGHPLAAAGRVRLEELNGLTVVGFDPDLRIRRGIDRKLAEHGVALRVEGVFDNVDTIKRAIMVNGSASFLPVASVERERRSGDLVAVHVEGLELKRPLGIIYHRRSGLGTMARRFVQFLGSVPDAELDHA